jgi:hypothetical protein
MTMIRAIRTAHLDIDAVHPSTEMLGGAVKSLLPAPPPTDGSADAAVELAKLLVALGKEESRSDRALEDCMDQERAAAEAKQVDALHEKADHALVAGVATALATAGAGGLTMLSGAAGPSTSAGVGWSGAAKGAEAGG